MTRSPDPWDCVHDGTTLRGLAALRRAHPTRWAHRMHAAARRVGLTASVAEALRAGGLGLLLPYDADEAAASRLKATRQAARLLVDWYGDVPLGDVTERWLLRERRRQARQAEVSRDQVSRCFSLLRKLALRAARHEHEPARVLARLPPRKRKPLGWPAERPLPHGPTVEALMMDSAHHKDHRVSAAVALQAHVGATSCRVLALRVRDVDLDQGMVFVAIPGPDRRLVREAYVLTADARQAIQPWLRQRKRFGPNALLFPMRGDPERPTKSITKAIRRACERLGVEPVTMQQIRRLAQANLRQAGGTRAQVRGSRRVRPRSKPASYRLLRRQSQALRGLSRRPLRRLPRRAPRACSADQPELGKRKRGPQELWPLERPGPRERSEPSAGAPRPEPRWDDPSASIESELRDRMRSTALPRDLPPLPPLPAQVVQLPASVVQHTTVHVHGATPAQVDVAVQQAVALGMSLAEVLRRLGMNET